MPTFGIIYRCKDCNNQLSIDQYFNQEQDWEKFEIFCETMENVSSEDLLGELRRGRKEDEK